MYFTEEKSINEMDTLGIISMLRYVSTEEKKKILNTSFIKDKLRKELLEKCNDGDVYRNFRWLFEIIDIDDFFNIFNYDIIHEFYKELSRNDFPDFTEAYRKRDYNRLTKIDKDISKSQDINRNEYKLFVSLMEKNINKTMEYVLKDNNLFKEVMLMSDNLYSIFAGLDYKYIVEMIYKLEENNFFDNKTNFNFISSIDSSNQKQLLYEDFNNDVLIEILPYFNNNIISYFFENDKRAVYLYSKFPKWFVVDCVNNGIKFNREILLKDDFFDKLKNNSIIEFRKNINAIEKNNDYIIVEKKVFNYYKEIINEYAPGTGIFSIYNNFIDNPNLLKHCNDWNFIFSADISTIFANYINYDKEGNIYINNKDNLINDLKKETSKKISELVIDALFCDNIYNVWLNVKEMLRFNEKLEGSNKVLDEEKVKFYKMILDFDNVSSENKIELFNKLYDKNISFSFYDDLRKLKDLSYDMIKKDLIDLNNYENKNIDGNSVVYDLRDKKYTMLVRTQYRYRNISNNRRNCYSIISDENSITFGNGEDTIIYGYNSFDNDTVLHVLEQDAFSADIKNGVGSRYVNRVMTSKEITNGSSWYSEIELVNIQNGRNYMAKKPDYIVVYDCIRDIDKEESMRLNIPIVIINKTKLKDEDRIDTGFNFSRDLYINSSFDEAKYKNRR